MLLTALIFGVAVALVPLWSAVVDSFIVVDGAGRIDVAGGIVLASAAFKSKFQLRRIAVSSFFVPYGEI